MKAPRIISWGSGLVEVNWKYIRGTCRREPRAVIEIEDYRKLPKRVLAEGRVAVVLSTGRCGTKLLAKLLQGHREVDAYHEAAPNLILASKLAYEAHEQGASGDALRLALIASRYELVEASYLKSKLFFEANNRLTFFAPALASLFPRAKFVHLVRHPGAFVRSGIRRGYYTGRHSWDEGRILPLREDTPWQGMSAIERNAWLWNETNRFIERFKQQIPADSALTIRAEDLFADPDTVTDICSFLGVAPVRRGRVERCTRTPVNAQRTGSFPRYEGWSAEQKAELQGHAVLAPQYGYRV